jgi:hypothetical protein
MRETGTGQQVAQLLDSYMMMMMMMVVVVVMNCYQVEVKLVHEE